jgi:hypothetical protein
MSTTGANGRAQRKSLAEQIDRLDLILDGLADGLSAAVADAVTAAVGTAVETAVREVLSNPELLRRLRPEPAPAAGKVTGLARWLCVGLAGALRRCWGGVSTATARVRQKAADVTAVLRAGRQALVGRVRGGLSALGRRVWLGGALLVLLARRYRKPLLVALAVGATVGLGCYLAGPAVSSVVSGLAGFVGSLVAGSRDRLRRMLAGEEWSGGCLGRARAAAAGRCAS